LKWGTKISNFTTKLNKATLLMLTTKYIKPLRLQNKIPLKNPLPNKHTFIRWVST
jgi:hypothetical protein